MKHRSKNFSLDGIILKRNKVGETDRIITILTQEHGKLVAVAKGVRKISSSKRAFLEPGNLVKAYFVKTKSLPLLTQAKLINDCGQIRNNLAEIRKITQFLEVLEKLFVEDEVEESLFHSIIELRQRIVNQTISNIQIKKGLENIIEKLGYPHLKNSKFDSILGYVSSLTNKPMHSFEYLDTSEQ
jgi:DNA repair protein RecO